MRDRLTYSNVVATLALFVALGGTGYAAATITSSDIKNRTIRGGDVRKNALGGTEINEAKLRTVPNARRAQTAAGADISKNAETANQATTATTATSAALADVAKDAQSLAGQGASSFEKSTRVMFGSAPASPAGPPDEQTLFAWPEMGVAITSSSSACGAGEARVAVRNTKSSGPLADVYTDENGFEGSAAAGGAERFCGDGGSGPDVSGTVSDSTGRTLFYDCVQVDNRLRCLGVRSEA